MSTKILVLFCLLITVLLITGLAEAQQPGKVFRIGYLDNNTASGMAVHIDTFWQEMRKLGWIEGKNIAIEYRFAELKRERVPELAADLVRLKVDLLVVPRPSPQLPARGLPLPYPS